MDGFEGYAASPFAASDRLSAHQRQQRRQQQQQECMDHQCATRVEGQGHKPAPRKSASCCARRPQLRSVSFYDGDGALDPPLSKVLSALQDNPNSRQPRQLPLRARNKSLLQLMHATNSALDYFGPRAADGPSSAPGSGEVYPAPPQSPMTHRQRPGLLSKCSSGRQALLKAQVSTTSNGSYSRLGGSPYSGWQSEEDGEEETFMVGGNSEASAPITCKLSQTLRLTPISDMEAYLHGTGSVFNPRTGSSLHIASSSEPNMRMDCPMSGNQDGAQSEADAAAADVGDDVPVDPDLVAAFRALSSGGSSMRPPATTSQPSSSAYVGAEPLHARSAPGKSSSIRALDLLAANIRPAHTRSGSGSSSSSAGASAPALPEQQSAKALGRISACSPPSSAASSRDVLAHGSSREASAHSGSRGASTHGGSQAPPLSLMARMFSSVPSGVWAARLQRSPQEGGGGSGRARSNSSLAGMGWGNKQTGLARSEAQQEGGGQGKDGLGENPSMQRRSLSCSTLPRLICKSPDTGSPLTAALRAPHATTATPLSCPLASPSPSFSPSPPSSMTPVRSLAGTPTMSREQSSGPSGEVWALSGRPKIAAAPAAGAQDGLATKQCAGNGSGFAAQPPQPPAGGKPLLHSSHASSSSLRPSSVLNFSNPALVMGPLSSDGPHSIDGISHSPPQASPSAGHLNKLQAGLLGSSLGALAKSFISPTTSELLRARLSERDADRMVMRRKERQEKESGKLPCLTTYD